MASQDQQLQAEGPFLAYQPSVDGHAALLALAAVLIAAVTALGLHSRRIFLASLLAASLVFQCVSYAGMLVLHSEPESRHAATAVVLGSLVGPAVAAAALVSALPGVAALGVGKDWSLSVGCAKHSAAIVAGLILEFLVVVEYAIFNVYFTYKAVSIPLASSKEYLPASSNYRFSQTKTWTAALNLATGILLTHIAYRIIEQAQGVAGTLFASQNLTIFLVEVLPLLAVAVSTASPPSPAHSTMGEMAAPAWPTYNDSSLPSSPTRSLSVEMPPYEQRPQRTPMTIQIPARGHSRSGSAASDAIAPPCLSPVWDNAREKVPVVVVDLEETRSEAQAERKWGRSRKRDSDEEMVVDPNDLW